VHSSSADRLLLHDTAVLLLLCCLIRACCVMQAREQLLVHSSSADRLLLHDSAVLLLICCFIRACCVMQAREQLLVHSSSADRLRLELKARDDEKAALEVLLAKESEAAAGRVRKADADAAALGEERAKRQRLQDENKVGWHRLCCVASFSTCCTWLKMAMEGCTYSCICMVWTMWLRVGSVTVGGFRCGMLLGQDKGTAARQAVSGELKHGTCRTVPAQTEHAAG
jgi:hypothetical protein